MIGIWSAALKMSMLHAGRISNGWAHDFIPMCSDILGRSSLSVDPTCKQTLKPYYEASSCPKALVKSEQLDAHQ